MNDVKIFGKSLTKQDIEALTTLAVDAGCNSKDIAVVDSVGEPDAKGADEVILILGTPATCAQAGLETEMAKTMNGGRRAVWVWPKDAATAEVPEGCTKYAYSAVTWDAKKLAAVMADDDVICLELPNGQPMPKVKMEHNECVQDPTKQKKTT